MNHFPFQSCFLDSDLEKFYDSEAGLLALLTGLVTISFQSFKAAIANPVNALKDE